MEKWFVINKGLILKSLEKSSESALSQRVLSETVR